MGTGGVAGNGNLADRSAGIVLGNFAARLRVRLSAGSSCVLDRVSVVRLARSVCRRSASGVSCALHPGTRARITCVAAPAARDGGFLERGDARGQTTLGAFCLRHPVDDRVQRDVAWDAGPVSNVSR